MTNSLAFASNNLAQLQDVAVSCDNLYTVRWQQSVAHSNHLHFRVELYTSTLCVSTVTLHLHHKAVT